MVKKTKIIVPSFIQSFWNHFLLIFCFLFIGMFISLFYIKFSVPNTFYSIGSAMSTSAKTSTTLNVTVYCASSYEVIEDARLSLENSGEKHSDGSAITFSDLEEGLVSSVNTSLYGFNITFTSKDKTICLVCANQLLTSAVNYCNTLDVTGKNLKIQSPAISVNPSKNVLEKQSVVLILISSLLAGWLCSICLDFFYGKIVCLNDLDNLENVYSLDLSSLSKGGKDE